MQVTQARRDKLGRECADCYLTRRGLPLYVMPDGSVRVVDELLIRRYDSVDAAEDRGFSKNLTPYLGE